MANVKIRDLSGAGALASTDIIEVTVDPSGTPASKKATIAQVRTAAANSWLSMLLETVTPPSVAGGNWTLGVQFCALRSGQTCVGLRFYWNGATARTIKCSLFKAGVGQVATTNVSVTAAGLYSAAWAGVAIDGTSDWYVAIYESSGSEYQPHVTISARVPARPVMLNYLLIQCGSYASGDAIPTEGTRPSIDAFMIEPLVDG
jgi:hypothetical protein